MRNIYLKMPGWSRRGDRRLWDGKTEGRHSFASFSSSSPRMNRPIISVRTRKFPLCFPIACCRVRFTCETGGFVVEEQDLGFGLGDINEGNEYMVVTPALQ